MKLHAASTSLRHLLTFHGTRGQQKLVEIRSKAFGQGRDGEALKRKVDYEAVSDIMVEGSTSLEMKHLDLRDDSKLFNDGSMKSLARVDLRRLKD